MNELLFYAFILALLYYFFYYLPQQKQTEPIKPLTHSQSTQTNPDPQPTEDQSVFASTIDELIQEIKKLNQQLK